MGKLQERFQAAHSARVQREAELAQWADLVCRPYSLRLLTPPADLAEDIADFIELLTGLGGGFTRTEDPKELRRLTSNDTEWARLLWRRHFAEKGPDGHTYLVPPLQSWNVGPSWLPQTPEIAVRTLGFMAHRVERHRTLGRWFALRRLPQLQRVEIQRMIEMFPSERTAIPVGAFSICLDPEPEWLWPVLHESSVRRPNFSQATRFVQRVPFGDGAHRGVAFTVTSDGRISEMVRWESKDGWRGAIRSDLSDPCDQALVREALLLVLEQLDDTGSPAVPTTV